MFFDNITHSSSEVPIVYMYKYSLVFADDHGDVVETIAVFDHLPTSIDWECWSNGWEFLGYKLQNRPVLIEYYDIAYPNKNKMS